MQTEILCSFCEGTRVSSKAGDIAIALKKQIISYRDFLKLDFKHSYEKLVILEKDLI